MREKALNVCIILGLFAIAIADNATLTCSSPPEIEGSMLPDLEGTEYVIGTSFTYGCNFGYVSRNSYNHISTCVNISGKAEWTIPDISCIPRSCGDPGYINNGRRVGNLFTFPNRITFECNEGYKIKGMNERYCQASGEWSGGLPNCELIYCFEPPHPENGRVKYSSLEYGTELQYQCNTGYKLEKHEPRYCTENKSWSNVEPKCIEVRCEVPIAPKYGRVNINGEPKVGSTATYFCDVDKVLVGEKLSKCLITGQWTYDPPVCLSYCAVPDIQHGEIGQITIEKISRYRNKEVFQKFFSGAQVLHDQRLTVRCAKDYVPSADGTVYENNQVDVICNDGTWSRIPQCIKTSCEGEPPTMKRGKAVIGSRKHGYGIWYDCDNPKDIKVKGNISCHFGNWIGITPQCLPSPCNTHHLHYPGLVKPPNNLIASSESFAIECKEGFRLAISERTIKCSAGTWNITQNPCVEDYCYTKDLNYEGLEKPREEFLTHLENFEISCGIGFTKSTQQTRITCFEGKWDVIENPCSRRNVNQEKVISPIDSAQETKHIGKENGSESSNHRISDLKPTKECYCTYYLADHNVIATGRDNVLKDGDQIRQGETVIFDCPYPRSLVWENGLVIHGKSNVTCTTCQKWEKTVNPKCSVTREAQPLIFLDDSFKMKPRGVLEVEAGKSFHLMCGSKSKHPEWFFRGERVVNISRSADGNDVSIFYSYITINNAGDENSGIYECITRSNPLDKDLRSVLNLQVKGVNQEIALPLTVSELEIKHVVIENGSESSNHTISDLEPTKECYCTYNRADYNVGAKVNGKVLKNGDHIKQGDIITFDCSIPRSLVWENGLVLHGKPNVTCTICQIWEKTVNPTCSVTREGQPFIVLDKLLKMKPRGMVEVEAGKSFQLLCGSASNYPELFFQGKRIENIGRVLSEGRIFYSYININNAGEENSGIYECILRSNSPDKDLRSVLDLQVKEYSCRTKELNYTGLMKPLRNFLRHSEFFNISCENGFKKTSLKSVISCFEGQWNATENPCTIEINEVSITPTASPATTTTRLPHVHLTTRPSIGVLENTNPIYSNSKDADECFCTYERQGFIIARAGDKILKQGNTVKLGETVTFECNDRKLLSWPNGLRVFGVANVTCTTCEKWRNTRNPACNVFQFGSPFVSLEYPLKLQSNGIAEVDVGQRFQLFCGSNYHYPTWYMPDSSEARNQQKFPAGGGTNTVLYYSSLVINASSDQINGKYVCGVDHYGTTTLEIRVRIPGCSIGDLYDSLSEGVIPDMAGVTGGFIPLGSTMQLACEDNLISNGNSTVKCKRSGKWQMGNFQCVPGCLLKLSTSSNLLVQPRKDSYRFGEDIVLSCPEEEELTSEVKRLMCLGEKGWSHPVPDCKKKK